MVHITIAIVLALSGLAGGTAYASQDSLPGDTLHPVKLGTEQVRMMLPGDAVARAERGLQFTDRRVTEIEALVQEDRTEYLELAAEKYQYALDTTLARIDEAIGKALPAEDVTARVAESTVRHMEALVSVFDEVPADLPDEAGQAIERAMEVSLEGYAAAVDALERMGVDISQLPGIPDELRQRLEDILGEIPIPTPGPPGGLPGGP